jgi:aryl carrier-like protein
MQPIHWGLMLNSMPQGQVPSFFSELAVGQQLKLQTHSDQPLVLGGTLLSSMAEMSTQERVRRLAAVVHECVETVAGQLDVGLDDPLMEAGLDSLAAIELRNELSQSFGGLPLSAGVLFDHPTVSRLALHLSSLLFSSTSTQEMGLVEQVPRF